MLDELRQTAPPPALDTASPVITLAAAGEVVVIRGGFGTGKTTALFIRAEQASAAGMTLWRATASAREQAVSWAVVHQLLGSTPDLDRRPATAEELARATIEHLPATGLLVTVDDAEHADEESLEYLHALAIRADRHPVMVQLAFDPARPRRILTALTATARVVDLGPLSPDAAAATVRAGVPDATDEYVQECVRVSGGNPFLLHALLHQPPEQGAIAAVAPEPVTRRVTAKLAALPPEAAKMATAIAVLGQECALPDAAFLADVPCDRAGRAADLLAQAGLLDPGHPLRFAQPVLGTAVHHAIPAFARSAAHRRAAELLAARRADEAEVIAHLLQTEPAGDLWVAERLTAAAQQAHRDDDNPTVVRLLGRAVAEPAALDRLPGLLIDLARSSLTTGDPRAAVHLEQVLRLPAAPEQHAHARTLLIEMRSILGDTDAALASLTAELEESLRIDGPATESLLSRFLTQAGLNATYQTRVGDLLTPLLARARAGDLPTDPGLAGQAAFHLAIRGAPADLVHTLAERALADDSLLDLHRHGLTLGFLLRGLIATDDLDYAETAASQAIAAARQRGAALVVAYAAYHRGLVRLRQGRLDAAHDDLLTAMAPRDDGWTGADPWQGEALARIELGRGCPAGVESALHLADGVEATSLAAPFVQHARAAAALAMGDFPRAYGDALRAGRSLADVFGLDHPSLVGWRHVAARAAAGLGKTADARRLAEAATNAAASPIETGMSLHTSAVVADRADRLDLLHAACTVLAPTPARLAQAEALLDLGRELRQAGRRADACEPLRQALDLAADTGARPVLDRIRRELGAAGARPRRTALRGPASLTTTERTVADLAATGLTNARIATELSVSRKTVETHLAHAYRKLTITHRAQLTTALQSAVMRPVETSG